MRDVHSWHQLHAPPASNRIPFPTLKKTTRRRVGVADDCARLARYSVRDRPHRPRRCRHNSPASSWLSGESWRHEHSGEVVATQGCMNDQRGFVTSHPAHPATHRLTSQTQQEGKQSSSGMTIYLAWIKLLWRALTKHRRQRINLCLHPLWILFSS